MNFIHPLVQGWAYLFTFVILGIFLRAWSLRQPMPSYPSNAITSFDFLFASLAFVVAGAVQVFLVPWCLENLRHWTVMSAWWQRTLAEWGTISRVIVYLLVTDLLGYWVHRFMHSRWAWRIHAFHHAIPALHWVSGIRGSPWHIVLILLPGAVVSGLLFIPENPWAFGVVMVWDVASQHLNHSNLRLPFVDKLEWVIVTPRMHFLHHSQDPRLGACNFGFYFSWCDRIFNTYVDAGKVTDPSALTLGLSTEYTTSSLWWGAHLVEKAH